MSHGLAALGGAGGLLAVGSVLNKIDWFADKPKLKLGTAAVVGILGGFGCSFTECSAIDNGCAPELLMAPAQFG